ncbi:NAD(P)-binding protein [Lipomyces doorenjongii]
MASKNYVKNIAVVGAGGRMGGAVVKALLAEGKHKVTAITRHDSTSEIPQGVTVKKANYDDPAALTEALQGQDALIITMASTAPPEQQMRLVEAAAAANIPWVMPNWYGGDGTNEALSKDIMLGARLQPVLKRIEELGKSSWINLACSFWYEWSLGGGFPGSGSAPLMYGFNWDERAVTFYDDGTTKTNTSTWPQAGLAVARLFALKVHPDGSDDKSPTISQFKNGYVYVSSFLVSQKDMFESVKRVTKTTDADWKISYEPSAKRYKEGMETLQKGVIMGFVKALYSRGLFPNGDGNFEAKHGLQNDILGLPKEDLDEATRAALRFGNVSF